MNEFNRLTSRLFKKKSNAQKRRAVAKRKLTQHERDVYAAIDRQKDGEMVNAVVRYTMWPVHPAQAEVLELEVQLTRKQLRKMQAADAKSALLLNYVKEM